MISIIKDICIFMIIAQAVLFFVPGSSYGKYVRLLVGIMMILRLTQPLFHLLTDEEERQKIAGRVARLGEAVSTQSHGLVVEDNRDGIVRSIEQELKERLDGCGGEYGIRAVALDQARGRVVVTLEAGKETGAPGGEIRIEPVRLGESGGPGSLPPESVMPQEEKERLRELYAGALGVEAGKVEILMEQEGG